MPNDTEPTDGVFPPTHFAESPLEDARNEIAELRQALANKQSGAMEARIALLQEMLTAHVDHSCDALVIKLLRIIDAHAGHEHYEAALQLIGAVPDGDMSEPEESTTQTCPLCNGGGEYKTHTGETVFPCNACGGCGEVP